MFIDDTEENVRSAEKLGFTGVVFTGYEDAVEKLDRIVWVRQGYAIYQSIDDESKRPDHIIDTIEELVLLEEKFRENH